MSLYPSRTGLSVKHWQKIMGVAEPLSVAVFFVVMLLMSWLKWCEPLIDFPHELYLAWRMNEGDLLYEKLASWYGPLPQLTQFAGFRLFGEGLDTIVWMNIALTVGVLLLLRAIFGTLGNRLTVWLCSVIFITVFAFNHCVRLGNANFITPYAAQTTYGFAGVLLVLWGLLRHIKSNRPGWLAVAGAGVAVAYLDKPEPLLAAAGAVVFYLVAQAIRLVRGPVRPFSYRSLLAITGWLAGGFFGLWLPVFLFFLTQGGLNYAIFATNYVPHTLLDHAIRETVNHSPYQLHVMGFDQPGENFRIQLLAGGMLILACETLALTAWGWTRANLFGPAWWIRLVSVVVLTAAAALGFGRNYDLYLFWFNMGRAIGFPVFLAAGAVAVWGLWSVWNNRADFPHILGLAVIGVAAALMLARMSLNITVYDDGFYMAPLAVFFLIQLMVVEAARRGPGSQRANWLLPAAFSCIVLFGSGVLGLASLRNYALETYPIGSGRDHFYTFPPEISSEGPILQAMINGFNHLAPKLLPKPRNLAVFPEGVAVNYHLRVPNPLPVAIYIPDHLGFATPQRVLGELSTHPPDVIFLHYMPYYNSPTGVKYFGDKPEGGRDILAWINDHYKHVDNSGDAQGDTITGHMIDLYLPTTSFLKTPSQTSAIAISQTLAN